MEPYLRKGQERMNTSLLGPAVSPSAQESVANMSPWFFVRFLSSGFLSGIVFFLAWSISS
jgi:hypothetical protein